MDLITNSSTIRSRKGECSPPPPMNGGNRFYTPVFRRDVLWYGDVRPSVRVSVHPSVRHSFPHFSPTCFDIFFWNFVYHFIFMHVRSSSNAINFRHFLQELCSFLTSNSYKYAVFRTFLLLDWMIQSLVLMTRDWILYMQLCIKVGQSGCPKLHKDLWTPVIKSCYIVIIEQYATHFHQLFTFYS